MFTLLKMMREKEQLKNPIDLNAVRNIYHENRSLFTWPRDDREARDKREDTDRGEARDIREAMDMDEAREERRELREIRDIGGVRDRTRNTARGNRERTRNNARQNIVTVDEYNLKDIIIDKILNFCKSIRIIRLQCLVIALVFLTLLKVINFTKDILVLNK